MTRTALIWLAFLAAIAVPVALSALSPLLAYRSAVYIAAGLAGVLGMAVLLVQPLLATGILPGLQGGAARGVHRAVGGLLVALVLVHVAALWLTSPPDVIDALTFTAPTWFSVWGVIAMWAIFAAALLAALRRRLRPAFWRRGHRTLALVIACGSVVHALLIEGTMEPVSKWVICALVIGASLWAVLSSRTWRQ